MSEARAATFRTVGSAQATPTWMVAPHECVASAAFPRHGVPIASPPPAPEPMPEPEPAPTSDVVPSSAAARVPSIPAPPPVPEIATPDPALLDALAALASAREETIAHLEADVTSLAVDVARALIDAELEARPELHRRLVQSALETLGPGTPRVRVAQTSYDAMVRALGGPTFQIEGRTLTIEVDPALTGAGVVLETSDARVDGTIESRLAAIRAELARANDRRAA